MTKQEKKEYNKRYYAAKVNHDPLPYKPAMTIRQIATELGVSPQYIHKVLKRATAKFRTNWNKAGYIYETI